MLNRICPVFSLALVLALGMLYTQTAAAEDSSSSGDAQYYPDNGLQLEEVLVTARKKQESLQDSPVAVSALSETALKEAGIFNTSDLQQNVPGLSFAAMGTKNPSIFIRGVGQKEVNAALDPGVGVYINGIFIARTDGQLLDTVDTASIQVLRGPQGTLFGKNNTGGAILVTTIAPSFDDILGSATLRIGNYGRRDAKISLNVPFSNTLAMRASIASTKLDGYIKNEYDGSLYGDEDRIAATSRILWEADDANSVDIFLYASKQNEHGAFFTCLLANRSANIPSLVFAETDDINAWERDCQKSEQLADDYKIYINGPSAMKMTNTIAAVTYKHLFENGVEFKSITSWARQEDIFVEDDQDATPVAAVANGGVTWKRTMEAAGIDPGKERRTQIAQELQFQGSGFDERLSYTVGTFFSLEEILDNPFAQAVGPNSFAAQYVNLYGIVPAGPNQQSYIDLIANLLGLDPNDDGVMITVPVFWGNISDMRYQTSAAFAQFSYDISDEWQATIGMRQTFERRRRKAKRIEIDAAELSARINDQGYDVIYIPQLATLFSGYILPLDNDIPTNYALLNEIAANAPAIPYTEPVTNSLEESWTDFSPTFTIKYSMSDALLDGIDSLESFMSYFTLSEGFKAGGFEPRGPELVAFDPETVRNKEIGFKVDALGSRVRLNGALYEMDYKDMQQRIAERGTRISDLFLFISNASAATISGYELELTALVTQSISLFANYNYTNTEYDDFATTVIEFQGLIPVEGQRDRTDEPFAQVPERTWNIGVNFDWFTNIGAFTLRLSSYFQDEIFIGTDATGQDYAQSFLDAYRLYNARVTYQPSERLTFTAYVDNITDEQYFAGGFAVPDSLGSADPSLGPPRMYGLEIQCNY